MSGPGINAPLIQTINGTSATNGSQAFAGFVHGNVYYGNDRGPYNRNDESHKSSTSRALMNVLIMSSDPQNADRLRLQTERRELEDALRGTPFRETFSLHDIGSCRVRDITRALDEYNPKILHFSGHGSVSGIYFEKDDGQAILVDKTALGRLLGTQKGLDLVVLNACYSGDQAQAIANAVGYVIGMEGSILDEDAIDFTREFYRALGAGRTYEDAFERAQLAVGLTSDLNLHLLKRST